MVAITKYRIDDTYFVIICLLKNYIQPLNARNHHVNHVVMIKSCNQLTVKIKPRKKII